MSCFNSGNPAVRSLFNLFNFTNCCDHNPLSFLHNLKNKNKRLLRWSLLLQEFNLDIRHIKGKDNIIPDVLSGV